MNEQSGYYGITKKGLEELSKELETKAKGLYWRGFFHGTVMALSSAILLIWLM